MIIINANKDNKNNNNINSNNSNSKMVGALHSRWPDGQTERSALCEFALFRQHLLCALLITRRFDSIRFDDNRYNRFRMSSVEKKMLSWSWWSSIIGTIIMIIIDYDNSNYSYCGGGGKLNQISNANHELVKVDWTTHTNNLINNEYLI